MVVVGWQALGRQSVYLAPVEARSWEEQLCGWGELTLAGEQKPKWAECTWMNTGSGWVLRWGLHGKENKTRLNDISELSVRSRGGWPKRVKLGTTNPGTWVYSWWISVLFVSSPFYFYFLYSCDLFKTSFLLLTLLHVSSFCSFAHLHPAPAPLPSGYHLTIVSVYGYVHMFFG